MKVLALSGSNADNSFNEKLLKAIIKDLGDKYDFDFATVKGLPMYKEGVDAPASVLALGKKIADADMVLIASPEQQHSVSSALKSALEWLSSSVHPFHDKPFQGSGDIPHSPDLFPLIHGIPLQLLPYFPVQSNTDRAAP